MPRSFRLVPVVAVLAAALLTSAQIARAAAPQFWRFEGVRALLEGDLENLSVDSEGRLRLGPEPRALFDPQVPNAWSVTRDGKGALVVGTGSDGQVFRVEETDPPSGKVVLDADELEVHSVVVGPDGRIYAATSPDGAVRVIEKDGTSRVFFDPPDTYIWALAFDSAGRLLVATGAEGRVYRVSPDGSSETLLDSSQTHVLSLAVDAHDRVYAGTAPDGIVYRIDGPGKAFVLLDSSFREVKALALAPDGGIFAAVVDGGGGAETAKPPTAPAPSSAPATPPVAEVSVTESFAVVAPAASLGPSPSGAPAGATPAAPKGAVLHIDATGAVDTLWTSTDDTPQSLLGAGRGVLLGTGDRGKVYRVEADGTWSLVATLPAKQVTALCADGKGTVAATSNPARLFTLSDTTAATGSFTSAVRDAQTVAAWGQVRWEGRVPPGASVHLETRAGNTSTPDSTWGPWVAAPGVGRSGSIRSEGARFLQVRVTLTGKEGKTPEIEAVSAAYLQRNLRPEVRSITVHPAGEVFQKPISVSGEPEILGLEPDPLTEAAADRSIPGMPSATSFSRKLHQRGLRTFSWSADDPNGDALVYEVQYRLVGDTHWRRLRRNVTEPVLAWDTSSVPDGRYLIRVIASDAPDNPLALALTGEKDSTSFEVDNAPPVLEATLLPGSAARIRATARDAGSSIRRLEISVDAGRWQEVYPVDGIDDSPEETYEFPVPPADAPGPRVIVLRVSDRLGNVATGRVDVP
jgi:sugar lactone lactonase YvrE